MTAATAVTASEGDVQQIVPAPRQYLGRVPQTPPTAVVLTALAVEYAAVATYLTDPREVVLDDGTRLELGRLEGTPWTLALAQFGEGALEAAALTTRIIAELAPEAVLFVGVTGGLKDELRLGDVVVGTKVYAIHGDRQTPEGAGASPAAKHLADAAGSQRLAATRAAAVAAATLRGHSPRGHSPCEHSPRERPRPEGPTYGGDHIDFSGGTFYGPVTGKRTGG